jgi:N-methylhydantoinase B
VRDLEALDEMQFSLLTERRCHAPGGAGGGEDGAIGRNLLARGGGPFAALPSKANGRLESGDRLRLETPGGGGYGPPRRGSDGPQSPSQGARSGSGRGKER